MSTTSWCRYQIDIALAHWCTVLGPADNPRSALAFSERIIITCAGGVLLTLKWWNNFWAMSSLGNSFIEVATQALGILPSLCVAAFFLN